MIERSLLIKFLGENPVFRIIDFLIENKGLDVTKKEIIEGAEISRASLFKCWKQLEEQEIVLICQDLSRICSFANLEHAQEPNYFNGRFLTKRKFGKTKLYALNSANPVVRKLLELELVL